MTVRLIRQGQQTNIAESHYVIDEGDIKPVNSLDDRGNIITKIITGSELIENLVAGGINKYIFSEKSNSWNKIEYKKEDAKYLVGLSANIKPTNVPVGSTFYETDTKNKYIFDGTSWSINNPLPIGISSGNNVIGKVGVQVAGGDISTSNAMPVKMVGSNKLAPITALNGVTANTTSDELNLTGSNSIKFYVEITGTGVVQIDVLGSCVSGGNFISNGVSKYFSTSQSFMIPCTSDYIKAKLTILSGTPTVTLRVQGMVDCGVDDVIPKYRDLGQVINTTTVAAGAYIYSNWVDDVQWVRNSIALISIDQNYNYGIEIRDTTKGTFNNTTDAFTGQGAKPVGGYDRRIIATSLGYSVRFYLKNSGASATTFAKMNMQLSGV